MRGSLVGVQVVGNRHATQPRRCAAHHRGKARVALDHAALRVEEHHAQRHVVEDAAQPLFTLAQCGLCGCALADLTPQLGGAACTARSVRRVWPVTVSSSAPSKDTAARPTSDNIQVASRSPRSAPASAAMRSSSTLPPSVSGRMVASSAGRAARVSQPGAAGQAPPCGGGVGVHQAPMQVAL